MNVLDYCGIMHKLCTGSAHSRDVGHMLRDGIGSALSNFISICTFQSHSSRGQTLHPSGVGALDIGVTNH